MNWSKLIQDLMGVKMRQAVVLKEIYFDTSKECHVFVDSIKDTRKGPYVHYRYIDTDQWGRKPIAEFQSRFEITRPIGSSDLKEQSIKQYNKAKVSNKDESFQYDNIIHVDFVNRCKVS